MTLFIAGLVIFFGLHLFTSFRSRVPEQDIRKKWGEAKYMGLYSVISLIGFVLIVMGYGDMRPSTVLYTPPMWGAHINLLLMALALILFTASQMPAGHIKKTLKHPMLVSIKIWAIGHLLANGELNSVLLFGVFLAYAVISRIKAKRRGDMGAANAVPRPMWDLIAVFVGLGLYAAFALGLHGTLIGVDIIHGASW